MSKDISTTDNERFGQEMPPPETDLSVLRAEVVRLEKAVQAIADIGQRQRIEAQIDRLKGNLLKQLEHVNQANHEAQDALRKSRDQLNIVLNGVTDGITVLDRQGRFVYANEVGARMCGFSSARELIETPPALVMGRFEILDEEGRPFPISRLPGRLALQGIKNSHEVLVQFRFVGNPEVKWSLVTASPIFDEHGEVQFAVSIFRDFTQRKKGELEKEKLLQAVASERARLEAIINQLGAGVIIVQGSSGNVLLRNRKALEIWRYADLPMEAVERHRELKAWHPDGRPFAPQDWPSYRSIHHGEAVKNLEMEIGRGDGTRGYISVSSDPIRDAEGGIIAAVVTAQDITELRRQERVSRFLDEATRLLSSSLDYRTTLERVADLVIQRLGGWVGISLAGDEGKLEQIVVAHTDEKKIPIAHELRRLYPPDPESGIEQQVVRTGKPVFIPEITEEMIVSRTKDERHGQMIRDLGLKALISTPLISSEGTFGVINLASSDRSYDRKDLSMAEELAKRASLAIDNARLYQKARDAIRVRDEFFSVASHELMTPITSLKLELQLAKRRIQPERNKMPPPEKLKTMIDVWSIQVERLTDLVGDLLDVSRIQAGKLAFSFRECKVEEIVREVIDRFSEQLEQARCAVELPAGPSITATWDRFRMEQVFVNLISNAIKYAPGAPIRIHAASNGEHATLSVQDSGPGIPKDRHAKIFERFERGANARGVNGLGLGLSIVKEIVAGHQGEIHVESEVGRGAKFILHIPLCPNTGQG